MNQIAMTHEEFLTALRVWAEENRGLDKSEKISVNLCTNNDGAIIAVVIEAKPRPPA